MKPRVNELNYESEAEKIFEKLRLRREWRNAILASKPMRAAVLEHKCPLEMEVQRALDLIRNRKKGHSIEQGVEAYNDQVIRNLNLSEDGLYKPLDNWELGFILEKEGLNADLK